MNVPMSDLQQNWPIYLDYNEDTLYIRLAGRRDTKWTLSNTSSLFYTSIPVPVSPIIFTFELHLNILQEWKQTLLKNTGCHDLNHYIAQLMTRPTTTILVASDGSESEQESTMSFGWVISLLDSTTLAVYSSPVFGQASLFQAEGYGLLSVTHFLYHLQIYTQLTPA
eukprot:17396-Ditylum_brightwellii.AAC.1